MFFVSNQNFTSLNESSTYILNSTIPVISRSPGFYGNSVTLYKIFAHIISRTVTLETSINHFFINIFNGLILWFRGFCIFLAYRQYCCCNLFWTLAGGLKVHLLCFQLNKNFLFEYQTQNWYFSSSVYKKFKNFFCHGK